ncbi:MAG: hypothetical protein JWN98_764, partial [Abditibacteriota bacterium]|nr:hypothetical protein [Abditibacteriota bacterium]
MPDRTPTPPALPQNTSSKTPLARQSAVIQRPPFLRPPTLWCVLPSCLFFALAATYQNKELPPLPQTITSAIVIEEQVLPISQTMIVKSTKTSGSVLLRGTIQPAGQVVGEAPVGGQVSRVWVRRGQRVEVGERILEISSGGSTRPAPAAERGQSAAEAAQIAAVNRQQQLERRMRDAQAQFHEAELRVEAAKRNVGQARALVARLQRGEMVPLPGVASNSAERASSSAREARRPGRERPTTKRSSTTEAGNTAETKLAAERRDAMQEALEAQRTMESLQTKSRNAFYAASSAEKQARLKKDKVESAQAEARKVQEKFDNGQADAAALEAARRTLNEHESEAAEAASKTSAAREAATRLQAQANDAKLLSDKAGQRAAQALQKIQLFANSPGASATQINEPTPEDTTAPSNESASHREGARKYLSPEAAVRLVRAAIRESDEAVKAAAQLKSEAENYSRQVSSTKSRLESSAQELAQAQQRVLDSTIQANLSSVRAPASGIVTSIASVAQEVSSGEGIVSISRSTRMEVVFHDTTGIWRHLHQGMQLPAAVLLSKATSNAPAPNAGARASRAGIQASLTQYSDFQGSHSMAATIRLRDIEKPVNPDQSTSVDRTRPMKPVEVRGVIARDDAGRRAGERLRAGQSVVCSVAKPGTRETIMVPANAIVSTSDGRRMIAVLTPVAVDASLAQPQTAAPASSSGVPASVPNEAKKMDGNYSIQWRPVVVGQGDGIQQEIRS